MYKMFQNNDNFHLSKNIQQSITDTPHAMQNVTIQKPLHDHTSVKYFHTNHMLPYKCPMQSYKRRVGNSVTIQTLHIQKTCATFVWLPFFMRNNWI